MTRAEASFWAIAPSPAAEPWVADALCAQTDPEAFFPEKGGSTLAAKKICARCPVEVECLEWALVNDERFGVWGNTSQQERKQIRARLGLTDSDDDVPEGDEPSMTTTDPTVTTEQVARMLKYALHGTPVRKIATIMDAPVGDVQETLTSNGHPDVNAMRRALERLTPRADAEGRPTTLPTPSAVKPRPPASVTVLPDRPKVVPAVPTIDDLLDEAADHPAARVRQAADRVSKAVARLRAALVEENEKAVEKERIAKERAKLLAQKKKIDEQLGKLGHKPADHGPTKLLPPGVTPAMVRRWAAENDIEVSVTGRVAKSVVEQYVAAHSTDARTEALHEGAWKSPKAGAEA